MKTLLVLSSCLLFSATHAKEIKCPDSYPTKETTLQEKPAGHEGAGIVRGAKLSSAYISIGKLHADPNGFDAMQLVPKRVQGGWDTDDSFSPRETKWLVCVYGGDGRLSVKNPRVTGNIEWWEKIEANIGHCSLHFREVKFPAGARSEWTATATCE